MARTGHHGHSTALLGTQLATLWLETSVVVGMRMTMLALQGTHIPEGRRMVEEKGPALMDAGNRAASVAMRSLVARPYDPYGAYLDAASAYTASVTRKVRGNRRRLTKV